MLRDWSTGKLPRYTVPPATQPSNTEVSEDSDATILATLSSRKELRRTSGLVKLKSGEIDSRHVAFEVLWVVQKALGSSEESDDDLEEEVGGSDEIDSGSDNDGDEGEDEDDEGGGEEEDEMEPPPPGKRKRGPTQPPSKPAKKVAFAIEPKKQGRKISQSAPKPATQKRSAKPPTASQKRPVGAAPLTKSQVASSSSTKAKATPKPTGSEEAYDFKKFF